MARFLFYLASITITIRLLFPTQIFAQDHYLVINPEGHKAIIYGTDVDAEGNLVTGSFDKTVKVYDLKNGFIKREFLGQIGPGSEGMVYSVDVSPDNKYIAVSGWMGKDDESEDLGDIRIYDYKTGTLKQRLKFHQDVVKTVKFSGGVEYSMESAEWKNGLFTYCLLNGLKSKSADLTKDGRILISELRFYVQFTVGEVSKGKQTPSSRFENISLDYAIW